MADDSKPRGDALKVTNHEVLETFNLCGRELVKLKPEQQKRVMQALCHVLDVWPTRETY